MDIGHLHPIFLHFPIVLLVLAIFCDIYMVIFKNKFVYNVGHWMIILGTFTIVPTIITGLYAAKSLDPDDYYIHLHKTSAFLTLGISTIHTIARIALLRGYTIFSPKWYTGFSALNIIFVIIVGDTGGIITHGSSPFLELSPQKKIRLEYTDPYKVRFFTGEELQKYFQEEVSVIDVVPIFERGKCAKCHASYYSGGMPTNFANDNGSGAWLQRDENGNLINWDESIFYESIIKKNTMPIDKNNRKIGLSIGDRLILLQWLKNGAPFYIRIEVEEEDEEENFEDWEDF